MGNMGGSVTSARYKLNPRRENHAGDEGKGDWGAHMEMRSARAILS
jgi:hypothetical protein